MKSVFQKPVLFVLPIFYVILSVIFLNSIKHFYIGHYDPPYIYLMTGTNMAGGHFRVGNIEPPGTPVDCFSGLVIFTKHLFSGSIPVYQDVLTNPENYLFAISIVLTILLSLITFWCGHYVYKNTGSIVQALLFQVSPLFFNDTVRMTVSLSAESLIVLVGMFYMTYLYVNISKTPDNKNVIIFGLFSALMITTKLYCAPVLILTVCLINSRKQKIIYLISSAVFGLLLLFPLYNQFRIFLGGIKTTFFHQGFYGQGTSGIIDPTAYKNNISDIFTTNVAFTFVFVILITALIMAIVSRKKEENNAYYINSLSGILLSFIAFILIIAKHYKFNYPEPVSHTVVTITKFYYFIPLFICAPIAIAISAKPFISNAHINFLQQQKQKIGLSIIVIIALCGGWQAYQVCNDAKNQHVNLERTNTFLKSNKDTPKIIISDNDKVCPETALYLGICFAGKWDSPQYFDFIKQLYPLSYLYTTWNDQLLFWDKSTDISSILSKNGKALVYISGSDSTAETNIMKRICGTTKLNLLPSYSKAYSSANRYETIYLVSYDKMQ